MTVGLNVMHFMTKRLIPNLIGHQIYFSKTVVTSRSSKGMKSDLIRYSGVQCSAVQKEIDSTVQYSTVQYSSFR